MRITVRSSLAGSLLVIYSAGSLAAGYALNEQGANAMGAANAGAAANPENATTVFFNPAGMARLDGLQWSVGGALLSVSSEFDGKAVDALGRPVTGTNGKDMVPLSFVPNAYLTYKADDLISVGMGVSAPFGLKADYEDSFVGRHFADKTEVEIIDFAFAMAFALRPDLSLGVGLDALHAKGRLSKFQDFSGEAQALSVLANRPVDLPEGHFDVSGDDWQMGWNVGLMYDPTASTTLGLTYRSSVAFDLQGKGELTNKPLINGSQFNGIATVYENAHVPLTTPESVAFSMRQGVGADLTLLAGVQWTRWSRFQNLDILSREGVGAISSGAGSKYGQPGMLGHVPERWQDTWAYSIGLAYRLNAIWSVKAGYAFDESPVPVAYRTARVPDTDRNWLTAGVQWRGAPGWTVDGAFGYLLIDDVKINEIEYKVDGAPLTLPLTNAASAARVEGEYTLDAWGLALQVSRAF